MSILSAVYQILNTITGDSYVGSSKDVLRRFLQHKYPSSWRRQQNSLLYKDIQKYGLNKFNFLIIKQIEPEYLKKEEQKYIELLHPTYNNRRSKALDIQRRKKHTQSDEYKKYRKKYYQSHKKYHKEYYQSNKEHFKEYY